MENRNGSNHRVKAYIVLCGLTLLLILYYSNCGPVSFQGQLNTTSNIPIVDASAAITVGAQGSNPPLDIFFVIDNSASMLGHQINLGNAFSNFFTSNSGALSNFNTNIYVFSTASTVNTNFLTEIPTTSPQSVSSVPAATSSSLALVPGNLFAIWNSATGVYGTAPFTADFFPASVLSTIGSSVSAPLSIARQGTQSAQQYQANINALTQEFQAKLAYLNPTNELSYTATTDISSGLCTVARILRHPTNFINQGDSAAFIVVSDDDDRLNDRNPNNNQCIDSVVGSNEIIDGTCGHYKTNFTYDTTATVTSQTDTKFSYQSGTQINYTYPSSESCHIQYRGGYNYTWTYTAVETTVTYTKCNQTADGTCLSETPGATAQIAGNYVSSGTACSQDMTSLVPSPAPGTTFTCASSNIANQTGSGGVDSNSNGTSCSSQLLAQLESQANKTNISCTITTASTSSTTIASQSIGSCANYCASNSAKYPGCTLSQTTTNISSGSLAFTEDGLTCASQCPNSTQCGSGTISAYITSQHATATCGTPTALMSTIVVNAGATSSGAALTCSSSLSGLTVHNSSNAVICGGQSTVQSCVASLQTGTATSPCAVSGGDTTTATAAVDVTCSTSCASSGGFCPSTYTTVGSYLAQSKQELCKSSSNGGATSLSLVFNSSLAGNATCSTPCSGVTSGSCDGLGWGATNGATVANYIASLKGDGCTSQTVQVSDTASFAVPASGTATACTTPVSPFFFASDSAHPQSSVTNYVAGDVNHLAADFQNYIVSQSKLVLGSNNPAAVAVIGHLSTDTSLYGTDPGTDYINLATAMNSNQVSSILGNYSTALGQISKFIVQTTQNSFSLPIPSADVVYSVMIMKDGTSTWVPVSSTLWTWSGSTLSVSPSANLGVGDQLMYNYHN